MPSYSLKNRFYKIDANRNISLDNKHIEQTLRKTEEILANLKKIDNLNIDKILADMQKISVNSAISYANFFDGKYNRQLNNIGNAVMEHMFSKIGNHLSDIKQNAFDFSNKGNFFQKLK